MTALVSQTAAQAAVVTAAAVVTLIAAAGVFARLRRLSKRSHTLLTGRDLGEARIAVYRRYPGAVLEEIAEMERHFDEEAR